MENLDNLLELIKNGQISIREASRQSGFTRDYLRKSLNAKFGIDSVAFESLQATVDKNKARNRVEIDPQLLEDVVLRTISGEITLSEAREKIGNIDMATLKECFLRFIQDNRNNEELLMKYRQYRRNEKSIDITKLNYRLLAIQMLKQRISQSDIAKQVGGTPRTISRKFEEFKNDEDQSLYHMIKFYNFRVMRRQKLSDYEGMILDLGIKTYEEKHPELLIKEAKSKAEEKLEKIQELVARSEELKQAGLTQAQVATNLGTSISSLRRARIFLQEHNLLNNTQSIQTESTKTTEHDYR